MEDQSRDHKPQLQRFQALDEYGLWCDAHVISTSECEGKTCYTLAWTKFKKFPHFDMKAGE